MKKIYTLIFMASLALGVTAQTGLRVGGHFGFNGVFIHNQNSYGFSEMDYETKFGIYPGIDVAYNFDGMNGVQVEVSFATMGQDYFDRNRDFSFDSDGGGPENAPKVDTYRQIDLNYIQIPVLYRFQTEKKKKATAVFHALIGPTFGFLMSADMAYQSDFLNNGELEDIELAVIEGAVPDFAATDEVEDASEYFRNFDMGIQFALGADIYASKTLYFTPELRAFYGFTDINSLPTRDLYTDFAFSRNTFVGLCVGIHVLTDN